ncbi:hypothetical protein GCM10027597_50890 [Saccharopolyspora tripterygii]
MPGGQRVLGGQHPVDQVQIGAAQAAGVHSHDHLPGRRCRIRYVCDCGLAWSFDHYGLHDHSSRPACLGARSLVRTGRGVLGLGRPGAMCRKS